MLTKVVLFSGFSVAAPVSCSKKLCDSFFGQHAVSPGWAEQELRSWSMTICSADLVPITVFYAANLIRNAYPWIVPTFAPIAAHGGFLLLGIVYKIQIIRTTDNSNANADGGKKPFGQLEFLFIIASCFIAYELIAMLSLILQSLRLLFIINQSRKIEGKTITLCWTEALIITLCLAGRILILSGIKPRFMTSIFFAIGCAIILFRTLQSAVTLRALAEISSTKESGRPPLPPPPSPPTSLREESNASETENDDVNHH